MTQENPTFKFELDLNEVNAILTGLQELPGKVCNPLSNKIKIQIQGQLQEIQANKTTATEG